ncbi:uncharacterized protein LOC110090652 isoform X1 [Pogona vitticeps]
MDVTQAAGAGGFLDPKVKIKEEDLVDPEASEVKEGAALPKLMGRSWEDVGLKVKQEPEEEPSGNWDARLQAFLKTLHAPHSARGTPPRPEQKQGNDPKMPQVPSQGLTDPNKWPKGLWVSPNQPHLVGKAEQDEETQLDALTHREKEKEGILAEDPLGAEIQCRRFRTLCYEDADGPRELCGQLLELCRQWLKPERHTKEQMVELVTLEQFLAILPLDMQSWLRQNDPVTCAEAVTLAEDFLLSRQEARDWGRQVLGMPEEEPSQNLPDVKIQLFEETKQEGDENVTLLTGGGWLRESEEEQPLVESPEETEQLTVLKTDKEDDSLFQGEPGENKPGLKGQNGQDEEGGEDLLAHDARKEDGETTVQLDENMEYNERGEIFGQSLQLSGQESTPEEVKSYKCWHCGQSFSSSSDLLIHERNHVGEQLYKCSHCGGSERIHMGRKPRKCSHCGNTFGCNPQQETNGETKLHTCSECGEKYIHISGLLRHQKTHRGEKAYKCLKCGENFGTYSGLRAHWRTHTGENQYKCLQCEMCFSGITRLRAHEKVHMAVCSSCGKTFSQKSELIEHERTHARENSFLCLDCGKAFEFHSELVAHVRTHRDKKLECPDSKNTLICSECGDTFRHSSALKAHQRVHRGEHKREQQDPEESAERPKEIKREPEDEASQAEEPRKKQKLMMETRSRAAAAEAAATQATVVATAAEAEAAAGEAGAEVAAAAIVKTEVAEEMSETDMADEQEPSHHEEDFGQEDEAEQPPANAAAAATRQQVPWLGFEDAVTYVSQKGKNLIVQCNYCLPLVKKLSSGITSASNVKQHLKKAHPEKLRAILDLIPAKQGRRSIYSEDSPEDEEEEGPPALRSRRSIHETVTQKMLDRTLMDYIVEEMVPLQTVDQPTFIALVRLGLPSDLKIMCPKTLRERIEKRATVMREALANRMGAVEYVATTADCWTEGRKSFLGVTAHWISPTTLKREFGALACKRLKGGLTYSVLAKALRDVHLQYGIHNKVVCTTTDNGSRFVKAFRAFKAEELRDASGSCADDDDDDDDHEVSQVEFVPISEILDTGHKVKGEDDVDLADLGLPPHQRCASYTLNLIATRDVEAMISDSCKTSPLGLFRKHFHSLMRKCSKLWSKQKQSAEMAEYIYDQCGAYLKTPNKSRWSSLFEALTQLNKLLSMAPLKMDAVMERCSLVSFTADERVVLQEYTEIMGPLSLSLDILQRENNMFMGYLLPTVYNLDRKFQGLENKPVPYAYCLPLLRGLREALRKRFAPVWEDKKLLLAACLHPRFKLDWLESSKTAQTNRFAMEALLNAELKGPVSETSDSSSEKDEEGDDVLLDFFDIKPQRRTSAVDPAEEELSKYLITPSREVSSLLAFPIIQQSFLKYNTGMPSSAAAERLFSTDGNLMTAKRHSLSDEVFEQLVLLRQNRASPAL